MSLDYQLTKIENYDEVCIQHFNDESWDLKLVTSHLIFMMLFIEMSGITRDNVGEVWARLNLMYGRKLISCLTLRRGSTRSRA